MRVACSGRKSSSTPGRQASRSSHHSAVDIETNAQSCTRKDSARHLGDRRFDDDGPLALLPASADLVVASSSIVIRESTPFTLMPVDHSMFAECETEDPGPDWNPGVGAAADICRRNPRQQLHPQRKPNRTRVLAALAASNSWGLISRHDATGRTRERDTATRPTSEGGAAGQASHQGGGERGHAYVRRRSGGSTHAATPPPARIAATMVLQQPMQQWQRARRPQRVRHQTWTSTPAEAPPHW